MTLFGAIVPKTQKRGYYEMLRYRQKTGTSKKRAVVKNTSFLANSEFVMQYQEIWRDGVKIGGLFLAHIFWYRQKKGIFYLLLILLFVGI